ncbi:SDR family NAD(P)-dependent oxidoreductase [Phenylobacterium montanum]|uniref:SDR family NAD(P)-dependent oxidoreductase n=1 Tax=Phenylobacterium montanum TaxID=2823693 RepID=A0A975G507_9CAUL|nr:SDR family NAD(P)-dependent oxidoreductase [Caulobacter sp. S6]
MLWTRSGVSPHRKWGKPEVSRRTVIVTGAGKGLGRAYALHLAASGAAVVVNNRWSDRSQPSSAEAVAAEIRAAGGAAVADIGSAEAPESGEALVALALSEFGRLDAVVANAGVPQFQRMRRQAPAEFDRIFDVNFFGTLNLVRAAWSVLTDQRAGRVVLSTSTAGLYGGDGMNAYAASKAALIGLMRALAVEGRLSGVMVNAIAPYALTAMTERFFDPGLGERMSPERVAPLVEWLAGPECDVTGQTFVAGDGAVAAAFAVEGPRFDLGDDAGAAARKAIQARPWRAFDDSGVAFKAFMAAQE